MSVEPNPFEDVERAVDKIVQSHLEIVRDLDRMEVDVTPWEASFLDNVLKQLEKKTPLSQGQIDIVRRMAEQYDIECDL